MAPGTLNEREKGREERSESARAREGEFNLAVEDWWWIVRDMRRRRRRRVEEVILLHVFSDRQFVVTV
jgi:hypothetical protein